MIKIVTAGLTMVALTYALARMSVGLFLPNIAQSLNLSTSEVGYIGSTGYFSYALSLAFTPVLITKLGSFYSILLAAASAILGMLGIASAPSFILLISFVFLAGIGGGIVSAGMTQVAKQTIPTSKVNQGNSLINSGASFGFIFIAPLILLMSQLWRMNYYFFALIGVLIFWMNYRYLPKKSVNITVGPRGNLKLDSLRKNLLLASLLFGFTTAIYWTFSRAFLMVQYGISQEHSMIIWLLMAISGIIGGFSGSLTNRIGLSRTFHLLFILMGFSIALFFLPHHFSMYVSAILFGATYLLLTGLLIIWATKAYHESPESGVSLSFFTLGIGQALGAFIAGITIDAVSYSFTFLVFSLLCLLSLLIKANEI